MPKPYEILKPGDEVLVRTTFRGLDREGYAKIQAAPGRMVHSVPVLEIEGLAPRRPRPIKVGDQVTWGVGANDYEVVHIHHDVAMLHGPNGTTVQFTSNLRHAKAPTHA